MRYKSVTLWHREADGSFKRKLFERAVISEIKAVKASGSERTENNSVRVRLYCISPCGVSVGDKLCMGYDAAMFPPDDAYTIVELKENFDASARLRHYKIEGR